MRTGNKSKNLLNEILRIIFSLYQANKIIKKLYNNVTNSIQYKMDTILFMSSKNSKISDPHKLIRDLTIKINSKRGDKNVALSNLSMCCTWKNI